ncbi:MAG: ABC transporter substrate-binding protein, partial [Candidatus Binatia bacterium]
AMDNRTERRCSTTGALRLLLTVANSVAVLIVAFTVISFAAEPTPTQQATPQWTKLVQAAKGEGTVVIGTASGDYYREVVGAAFRKEFGIKVEQIQGSASRITQKVVLEHKAGANSVDVWVLPTSGIVGVLAPSGAVTQLEPFLIVPDVINPSNWVDGKLPFVDKGRTALRVGSGLRPIFAYNTKLVPPKEVPKSIEELMTNPRWKNKVVAGHPSGGSSAATITRLLLALQGEEFVRRYAANKNFSFLPGINTQLELMNTARGTYEILLGTNAAFVEDLRKEGLPLDFKSIVNEIPGGHATSTSVAIATNPPHPNAAKLFANWVLSRKAISMIAELRVEYPMRTDAKVSNLHPEIRPRPNTLNTDTEEELARRDKLEDRVLQLFKEMGR